MSEVQKQESQKTVVAFITGLLIGGLLVWVFSATPEEKKQPSEKSAETKEEVVKTELKTEVTETKKEEVTEVIGTGSIIVLEQKAGQTVTLGKLELPTKNGWVVVRDYMDGVPANVLGAARYSVAEGLMPTVVDLVRGTTAGSSYQVVFYAEKGAAGFSISEDTVIDGIAATFKAN
ncbi:MAG: hypothetical protein WAW13_01890 [Minisyncoccia bacterium]